MPNTPKMSKQFKHSDMRRKSSVLYSTSVGKGGLFNPQDLLYSSSQGKNVFLENENENENEAGSREQSPLASLSSGNASYNTAKTQHHQQQGEQAHLLNNEPQAGYSSMDNLLTAQQQKGKPHGYSPLREEIGQDLENGESVQQSNQSTVNNSASEIYPELLEEERELLLDNKLIDSTDHDSSDIAAKWASANPEMLSTSYHREFKTLVKNAAPLVLTFLLQNSLSLASIFSVSHLGTKELGAITLGSMTANICGFAAIQGLCTCLDTLCSQAYGAKKYHLVGVFLQRCCALTILGFIPVQILWYFFSETLLKVFIEQEELCYLASKYLKIMVFSLPPFIVFECTKRFLQCQGIFHASTLVLLVCAPLNAFMNYLLVWNPYVGVGYLGAPISVVLNYWLMCLGLISYIVFTKNKINPRKCWGGFVQYDQIFNNWKQMINLAVPGIIMVEAEFVGFEILTIFAAKLGEDALAAQSIVATIASFAYQIPFSISISTSTRVANFIGAGLWKNCLITCKSALSLSFVISCTNLSIIFLLKHKIAQIFSSEPVVIKLVEQSLPILAVMQLFDAFNACTAGCLRGQGQQRKGSVINILAFYIIGVPMAYFLTFKLNLSGVTGLWLGIVNALIFMTVCQSMAVFNVNWKDLVKEAEARNEDPI